MNYYYSKRNEQDHALRYHNHDVRKQNNISTTRETQYQNKIISLLQERHSISKQNNIPTIRETLNISFKWVRNCYEYRFFFITMVGLTVLLLYIYMMLSAPTVKLA